MSAYLDSQPIATDALGPHASIGQLLDLVKTRVTGSGRLVLGMKCNEEDVEAEDIAAMLSAPITDFERLDFVSGRPQDMVLDALDAVRRAFEQTYQVVRDASESLSRGDAPRAMGLLSECFGVWGQTSDAVLTSGRLLNVDLETLHIEGRTISDWVADLVTKLREIKCAIEDRDSVLLGDILRYELDETMQAWDRMLVGYITFVEASGEQVSA
ncbi:MAG: hypothetical protein AABZ08_10335 [Planctomycetota bacterium]